jgi:hypothetical protein
MSKDKQDLHVIVIAPRDPDHPHTFTWNKHVRVSDAAAEAAAYFGYTGGSPGLTEDDRVLDGDKQLVAAGVDDGDTLELLDAGGGV